LHLIPLSYSGGFGHDAGMARPSTFAAGRADSYKKAFGPRFERGHGANFENFRGGDGD
jgi:hypothetical protein